MLEALTRWWLTKQNNWDAGLMFTFLMVVLIGLSLWAHADTEAWGLPIAIFLGALAVMAVVFVVLPLVLGMRYNIEPATRGKRPRS